MEHKNLPGYDRDFLLQFYRNGRWGTCVECPQDTNGHLYPEFCPNTKRGDHTLTITSLAEHYQVLTDRK